MFLRSGINKPRRAGFAGGTCAAATAAYSRLAGALNRPQVRTDPTGIALPRNAFYAPRRLLVIGSPRTAAARTAGQTVAEIIFIRSSRAAAVCNEFAKRRVFSALAASAAFSYRHLNGAGRKEIIRMKDAAATAAAAVAIPAAATAAGGENSNRSQSVRTEDAAYRTSP
jgi:hypothetical protein